jgi:hypothetical protein
MLFKKLIISTILILSIYTIYNINNYQTKSQTYNRNFKLSYRDKRFLSKNALHKIKKKFKIKI